MEFNAYSLADLGPGQQGSILRLTGSEESRQRLLEMGLTSGTVVQLVRAAPLGDPLQIIVRGYALSIRKSEARSIIVQAA